ncbi:hypothetical protein [Limnoglobus roseus]|uniref:Uncharacterized protein n=1 Tax=Limnoglobus roseus TaxID=2598579 RepID=A0A5C1AC28_9BACT|nr:hypothetical protein [Limnoglobus roseus]QEL14578.1 hypothetical protein PX52LOC_01468 [Limnoglobus roseus]
MLATCTLLLMLAPTRAEPTAPTPHFGRGDEMVYTGEVAEESTRVDLTNRRRFGLEVRIFVLETTDAFTDLAVLTLLQSKEDPNVAPAAAAVTGVDPAKNRTPPAVRLEMVRVDANGRTTLLVPKPMPPITLTAATETKAIPPVSLDSPTTLELGFLVPLPEKRPTLKAAWTISEMDRPDLTWAVAQSAVSNGAEVLELAGRQQTAKWENPSGLDKNWRRTDSVWVGTGDGLARQFTRTTETKEGLHVIEKRTVRCVLSSPPSPNRGEGYNAIRKEIDAAVSFAADLDAGRATRLSDRLDDFERRHRETPYRAALEAVRRRAK